MLTGLPVSLNCKDRLCIVVGGGSVATRRARSLMETGARVVVIAPEIKPELSALPGVETRQRVFEETDCEGAMLVVVATDDDDVNHAASEAARRTGALVNRADAPAEGDLVFPATHRVGPITLAVDTRNTSARAAASIRDDLASKLDPDWPRLLELAQPFRARIQQQAEDAAQRRSRLLALTDERAMRTLKDQGETALLAHFRALAGEGPA